jgi:hypothetical protein
MAIAYSTANSLGLFMRYKRIEKLHLYVMRRVLNAYRAIKNIIGINLKSVIRNYLIANRKELNC